MKKLITANDIRAAHARGEQAMSVVLRASIITPEAREVAELLGFSITECDESVPASTSPGAYKSESQRIRETIIAQLPEGQFTESLVAQLMEKVLKEKQSLELGTMQPSFTSVTGTSTVHEMGVFASLDDAVAAAKLAQQGLKSVAMRQLAIHAIREAGEKHARELAELAVSETGMGRVDDKFAKNVAQARGTPGVECLSPQVLTGDNGLTLIENAPWGVVASVTPSTNPAATVINNAISLIAAGNSVVFAPHPAAKKVSQRAITLLNQAVVAAGGPENLLVTVANPDSRRQRAAGGGVPRLGRRCA